jgi:subtilisin family serine protease
MRRTLLLAGLWLAGCGGGDGSDTAPSSLSSVPDTASSTAQGPSDPDPVADERLEVQQQLLLGPVDVIVSYADVAGVAPSTGSVAARATHQTWRVARLAEVRARAMAPLRGMTVLRAWDHLAAAHARLDSRAALDALLRRPDVRGVALVRSHRPSLTESLALVGQPAVVAAGTTGAGVSVAVLDTGADYTVADLGSCTAVGTPSSCRVAYAADFATADGTLDDASGHGTNVASIVSRMAPDAQILALDVFGSDGTASSVDILSAIEWVIAKRPTTSSR